MMIWVIRAETEQPAEPGRTRTFRTLMETKEEIIGVHSDQHLNHFYMKQFVSLNSHVFQQKLIY